MDILEIKNVAYSYANSKEKVLSGVNQKFELGKFYAIVGKSGAGKSTLLEDDNMIREGISEYLSEFGYTVIQAKDGREALSKFNSDINLVILY